MNEKFTKEIYNQLLAAVEALPKEAVESAKKETTRKGYDTTGYQYQFLVNVLNEVLTPAGWSFDYVLVKETEGKWSNGRIYYDVTVNVSMDILGAIRACAGGHRSEMYSDALKGAITNAFKKTVALYGVGKKAYEGTLDEDYQAIPLEEIIAPLIRPQSVRHSNPQPAQIAQGEFCPDCHSPMKWKRDGSKQYCAATCWLKKGQTALQQQSAPIPTISYDEPPIDEQIPF